MIAGFCPALSVTAKQASNSSTVQGGGEAANHHHLSTNSHTSKAITITIAMASMPFMRPPRGTQVSRASSMAPILFGLALHGGRFRILTFTQCGERPER
jgi:hypothetical protein